MFRSLHVLECDKEGCGGGNYISKIGVWIKVRMYCGSMGMWGGYRGITGKLDLRVSGKVAATEAGKVSKDQLREAGPSLPS